MRNDPAVTPDPFSSIVEYIEPTCCDGAQVKQTSHPIDESLYYRLQCIVLPALISCEERRK